MHLFHYFLPEISPWICNEFNIRLVFLLWDQTVPGTPRIVGGDPADRDEYPYAQVSFQSTNGHTCGGSVVAPDMILTAAHCLPDPDDIVVVGIYGFFNNAFLENVQAFRMEQFMVHPSFNEDTLHYDVMLIKVTGTITVTDPVQINQQASISSLLSSSSSNARLTTVGFGATSTMIVDGVEYGDSFADVLQELDLTLVDSASCEQIFTEYGVDFWVPIEFDWVTDDMMCAATQGAASCFGDSGSPLLILDRNDPSLMPLLVGLTSWSVNCEGKLPVVFHRTSQSFEWIRETICGLSNAPPDYLACNSAETLTVSPTMAPPVMPPTAAPSIKASTESPTQILMPLTEAPVDSLTDTSTFIGHASSVNGSTLSSSPTSASSSWKSNPCGISYQCLVVVPCSFLWTSWMIVALL